MSGPQYVKSPLPFDEYAKYSIDQYYQAFKIEFKSISIERCDDLEHDLILSGHKIFHTETKVNLGKFDIIFIVGESKVAY